MLRLDHLTLKNYRCFEQLDIDFHKNLTVLVAKNGVGKTAVLDAIAIALGPFLKPFDQGMDCPFKGWDARYFKARETGTLEMSQEEEVSLTARGQVDQALDTSWSRSRRNKKDARTTYADADVLFQYGTRLQEGIRRGDATAILPVVGYYGTGRLWAHMKLMGRKQATKETLQSRDLGYLDALNPSSHYKTFEDWFVYLAQARIDLLDEEQRTGQVDPAKGEIESFLQAVRSSVELCLPEWSDLRYSGKQQTITLTHPEQGELPVDLLSDGLRNMVGMVADIAYRATRLNPHLMAEAPQKTPGIVLIDEVDMHLHPGWQQTVLPSLTNAFPLVQFIVTTHSPQVLTSVPAECIQVLSEGRTYPVVGTEGAEASRILKRVFGVEVRPPNSPATKELEEYLGLVDAKQWDSPRAVELRKALDARYPDDEEPALVDADLRIENMKWEAGQ